MKTTFKPIVLDKNPNFYTCACKTNFVVEGSKYSTIYIVQLLTLVLKYNNFTFNGDHYHQINGTAIGTKMAPSYANIFMGKLEKQIF